MIQNTQTKQKGETMVYTSCMCDCGSTSQCVFKAHVKDGVIIRVEPDDRYNTGVGREDEVLSEHDLIKTRLQRRPCTKGLIFHKYIYHPDRILYPLKRAPNTKRGEGKYVRISWDEALDTIASKMKATRDRHGPYSLMIPYQPNLNLERLFSFWGAGVSGWGWGSYDSASMMAHIMTGQEEPTYSSGSAPDMLANSRMIVLWGFDPAMGSNGPAHQFAWFVKLARERGKPVIIIDPRYTPSAEVLSDQWIPIKPGTDIAMFLAMAFILFKEDLWDKDFVAKYVEPVGFEMWRNYVLGVEDGIKKTPEWAESKCAVPAETIHKLTRLVATTKPAWLWCHWGVSRKSRGEQTVRAFAALQAMLGYWGTPGAGPTFTIGPVRPVSWPTPLGPSGDYNVPKLYRSSYWSQAVLLLDKVRNAELSPEEYMRMVGWKADPSILKDFNPTMLFWGTFHPHATDHLVTAADSPNSQVKATEMMEFVVTMHSMMTASARYADLILPARDWMWEEKNVTKCPSYGGFECINYCPGVVRPPGEVKSWAWVYTKLTERLGIDPKSYFPYYTTDENWDRDWERYQTDCYQEVVDYYRKRNIDIPPWKEFTQGKFLNCDELEDEPFTGWDKQIKEGKPFETESGKIELYSNYLANEANRGKGEHYDSLGRRYEELPSDWGDLTPMPIYQATVRGMDDPLVKKYPLMLLSPHCRYRVHYLFWDHPWLKDHVYRHRVWINPTDAKARDIKDDDIVRVSNDQGKVVMPAYVTSRIMPGVVAIHHGGKYIPDECGVDRGASPSTLLGGDFEGGITPLKATTIVQVEKSQGE